MSKRKDRGAASSAPRQGVIGGLGVEGWLEPPKDTADPTIQYDYWTPEQARFQEMLRIKLDALTDFRGGVGLPLIPLTDRERYYARRASSRDGTPYDLERLWERFGPPEHRRPSFRDRADD